MQATVSEKKMKKAFREGEKLFLRTIAIPSTVVKYIMSLYFLTVGSCIAILLSYLFITNNRPEYCAITGTAIVLAVVLYYFAKKSLRKDTIKSLFYKTDEQFALHNEYFTYSYKDIAKPGKTFICLINLRNVHRVFFSGENMRLTLEGGFTLETYEDNKLINSETIGSISIVDVYEPSILITITSRLDAIAKIS